MTDNIVTLFGGNINNDRGSNGHNGANPPPVLPEPNDGAEKRRRRWQLRGMSLWQKELRVVQENLKDIDMLILAWQRGLLSDAELNNRLDMALKRVNLHEWGYHTSLLVGSFAIYLNHDPEPRLADSVQITTLWQEIYELVWASDDATLLSEVREMLTALYQILLDE
ncbi:hypothetical protein QUF58_01870 [Anaerolineales bacterium HSG24]|nr:hypothetical protein [Anaerolineales bacterium HSG24]